MAKKPTPTLTFAEAHLLLSAVKIAHAVRPSETTSKALDVALRVELEAARNV